MTSVPDTRLTSDLAKPARWATIGVPISLNVLSPLVALLDLCWIVLLGVVCGFVYEAAAFGGVEGTTSYLGTGMAAAMLYSAFAHAAGLYPAANLLRVRWQAGRSILIWAAVFVCLAGLVFVLKIGAMFSRGEVLLFFISGIVVTGSIRVAVGRIATFIIRVRLLAPRRIVLVGFAKELSRNQALRQLEKHGYAISQAFVLPAEANGDMLRERVRDVIRYVRDKAIDEVILAVPWNKLDVIRCVEDGLRILPVPVTLIPDLITSQMLRRRLSDLGPTKAVELQRAPLSLIQLVLKRGMDKVLAGAGVFALIPFLAVIAAAIRLESPGPVMFMQTRVGFNGRPFRMCKFRTMYTCEDGPVIIQAQRNDTRVTPFGGLLRKLSIDEIPQLFNVLRGEMSLVGPRPHALAHDNEYNRLIATYAIRHKMRPGITGWAQVNGHRGATPELGMMEQRIQNDLWYIEYWSLWLDVRILLLTVRLLAFEKAY
jgi:Undecaprenyl-phosphate glucose phosphotransferase